MLFLRILSILCEVLMIFTTPIILATACTYNDLRKLGMKKLANCKDYEKRKEINEKMELATLDAITWFCVGAFELAALLLNLTGLIVTR